MRLPTGSTAEHGTASRVATGWSCGRDEGEGLAFYARAWSSFVHVDASSDNDGDEHSSNPMTVDDLQVRAMAVMSSGSGEIPTAITLSLDLKQPPRETKGGDEYGGGKPRARIARPTQ